ncbi:hypothetical protein [Streptomyces avicenniae]|uniref:hypothetical protein n=1 Tax=Streptomyces avicenniae TaxID=500153 RepID=UPI0006997510|nr:hypothetical protein [Streptomyces avicenniae]
MTLDLPYFEELGGLTTRAEDFVARHAVWIEDAPAEEYRREWLGRGVPAELMDRMAAFGERWGGLVLPPTPEYSGGPRCLAASPIDPDYGRGRFGAGSARAAVPYGFMIGPVGEFGIAVNDRHNWTPLHASVEGWVEALALSYHASLASEHVTRCHGDDVEKIVLDGFEPVREVRGLADTWWRGADSLVAMYAGEATCLYAPQTRSAVVYSGMDRWGLHGGVEEADVAALAERWTSP